MLSKSLGIIDDVPAVAEYIAKMQETHQFAYDNLVKAQEVTKRKADSQRRPVSYRIGDKVLLSAKNIKLPVSLTRKFSSLYCGFYTVVKTINDVLVKLDLPEELGKMERVFHVSLLKHYYEDENTIGTRLQPVEINNELEWEVDKIIGKMLRGKKNELHYLVAWKGYPRSEARWRKKSKLEEDGVLHFVEDFEEA